VTRAEANLTPLVHQYYAHCRASLTQRTLNAPENPSTQAVHAPQRHYLGLSSPHIGEEEIDELLDAIRSGWLTTGPKVSAFQERLASYLEVPHVRCLSSCTAGLTIALRMLGVGPGDEVLLPSMTFVSCANAIEHFGARPVFVDSDPASGLIDLDHAEALVSERTRALMPVHLAGHPVDLDAVNRFRDRHGIAVVEDGAHAIGAAWRGRPIGSHGNLTSFSFHATKNITTFEGGALALPDEAAARRAERLALHGLSRSAWERHGATGPAAYEVAEPGFKFSMHDISAAVGIHQLGRLDGWIDRRAELSDLYDEALRELPLERPPRPPSHARHAHHLYIVRLRDEVSVDRDVLIERMQQHGVGCSVHFKAIHFYDYYRTRYDLEPGDLPVASHLSARALSLPLFPAMSEANVDHVASALRSLLS
jgi:dTDP-4-amino-4,6-dideoxygalactose transaminase